MQTTSIMKQKMISFPTWVQSSVLLSSCPLSGSFSPPKRIGGGSQRTCSISILAMKSDGKRDKPGRREYRVVDENMVVLKMRIQEMEMKEKEREKGDDEPLEELYKKNYDSDVYELVGLLQILMMNNRPSLVLGVVALFVFSLSTSLALLLFYLVGILM